MAKKENTREPRSAAQSAIVDAASRRRYRGGIALKFVVPTSLATAAGMAILGITVYFRAAAAFEESIQEAGLFAAGAAAAPDWSSPDNRKRLRGLLTDRVEDVIVWETAADGSERYVESATGRARLSIEGATAATPAPGDVLVKRFRMKNRSDSWIPCRSFRKPVASPLDAAKTLGHVEVIVSEESIERDLGAILIRIIVVSGLAVAASVGVAIFIAGKITSPLNLLIKDVEIVTKGDYSHRTRTHSFDEVGLLAETFDRMTHEVLTGLAAKADLETKKHQEQIAQEIQEKLIPSTLPAIPGVVADAVFESADEISSDLFDFVPVDPGRTGLLVMTAGGRGVPAAIMLAMARSVFRAVAPGEKSPATVLKRINALIAPDLRRGMYVTAAYSVVAHEDGAVRFASAGHKLPLLHFSAAEKKLGRLHPGGIAIGLDKGPVFDKSLEEAGTVLAAGDTLILGGSGVFQVKLESGEALGDQRFLKLVLQTLGHDPDVGASAIVERLGAVRASGAHDGDLTLISLRRES